MKDPYLVLGVSPTATHDEIKKGYHNQAKKFHPDLNPGNREAEAKFKEISVAYELIGNAKTRAQYDRGETVEQQQERQQQQRQRANKSRHTFHNSRDPFYHETQSKEGRYSFAFENNLWGSDEFYQMSIDFKDAVLGAEREMTLPHGKRLRVQIPAGVTSGLQLRFKNQASTLTTDGLGGDVYVQITVRESATFKRAGNDITTEVAVSFIEALVGAEIKVPTLDGHVLLTVPAGVSTGSRLRVRGKGVAGATPLTSGDLIVLMKVVLPTNVDPELQQLIRGWKGKYSYNPRENA